MPRCHHTPQLHPIPEIAFPLLEGKELEVEASLREAIQKVNDKVKLNVPLGISVDFGINYAKIH